MQIDSKPNTGLGQHFMISSGILATIVKNVPKNSVVVEVGAGTGNLTKLLAKKSRQVIAIEIDKRFKKDLFRIKQKQRNIDIVIGNVLDDGIGKLIKKVAKSKQSVYIVSNLPYQITEPFIKKAGDWKLKMILTVGKKFGYLAQISDSSNSKFTELSLITRSFFTVNKIADVPRSAFTPAPDTDSMILEFIPKNAVTTSDLLFRQLIVNQKSGGLIKNALMNSLIYLNRKKGINLTKNEARIVVNNLNLPEDVLNKSFAQLSNAEIRLVGQSIDSLN